MFKIELPAIARTIFAWLCLTLILFNGVYAQSDARRAVQLAKSGNYIEAAALFDKAAASNPSEPEFWAFYSFAVYSRSQTLETAAARKAERIRAKELAKKARELGSVSDSVLEIIETLPDDGGDEKFSSNPAVNAAMIEGEKYFGRAEFDKALTAYERVLKIDPKNYEATVFAGDTFYARKMYKESEPWFAKAVALDPDRDTAYRFWGDALMLQDKIVEARDKYVEALIADPYSRLTFEKLTNWAEASGNGWHPTGVAPPGGKFFGEIEFDEKLLKAEDGTINWLRYRTARELWRTQTFKQKFPNAKQYRHTLQEEAAALRLVAETTKLDLQTGKVKDVHESLINLIKISDADLLEPYVLFPRVNDEIMEDYNHYRKTNRAKLRRFIVEFLIGTNKTFKI